MELRLHIENTKHVHICRDKHSKTRHAAIRTRGGGGGGAVGGRAGSGCHLRVGAPGVPYGEAHNNLPSFQNIKSQDIRFYFRNFDF